MDDGHYDLGFVIPVLDDWQAFAVLARDLVTALDRPGMRMLILAVNDGGGTNAEPLALPRAQGECDLAVIDLACNLGHQRAIATGLAYLADHRPCRVVVVMDGDGEDRAEDVPSLLAECAKDHPRIVFAARRRRSEGPRFRMFYRIYKLLFRIATGRTIDFGNFCVIPQALLQRVVRVSEIWNHFAAGVARSRLPYSTVPVDRGVRASGASRMNVYGLMIHGLSAISVFVDQMALRLMLASASVVAASVVLALGAVAVRAFTELAIPGWATVVFTTAIVIGLQGTTAFLILLFFMLSARSQRQVIPSRDYMQYVQGVRPLA